MKNQKTLSVSKLLARSMRVVVVAVSIAVGILVFVAVTLFIRGGKAVMLFTRGGEMEVILGVLATLTASICCFLVALYVRRRKPILRLVQEAEKRFTLIVDVAHQGRLLPLLERSQELIAECIDLNTHRSTFTSEKVGVDWFGSQPSLKWLATYSVTIVNITGSRVEGGVNRTLFSQDENSDVNVRTAWTDFWSTKRTTVTWYVLGQADIEEQDLISVPITRGLQKALLLREACKLRDSCTTSRFPNVLLQWIFDMLVSFDLGGPTIKFQLGECLRVPALRFDFEVSQNVSLQPIQVRFRTTGYIFLMPNGEYWVWVPRPSALRSDLPEEMLRIMGSSHLAISSYDPTAIAARICNKDVVTIMKPHFVVDWSVETHDPFPAFTAKLFQTLLTSEWSQVVCCSTPTCKVEMSAKPYISITLATEGFGVVQIEKLKVAASFMLKAMQRLER